MKKMGILLSIFALLIVLLSCGSAPQGEEDNGKIIAAVSILPQKAFVEAVCGDLAEVIVTVPPGFSPEVYEPTPREMATLSEADIYFAIGVPVEETGMLEALSAKTVLVPLDEACRGRYDDLQIDNGRDPHIWLSMKRAVVMVEAIAEEMAKLDPDNAQVYAGNAASYISELEAASLEISDILKDIPQRKFIVFHPAFGYFADEYGLTMLALEEHGKEATAATLMEMTELAKAESIRVIFYQAEIDSSQSAAFAEEIGGRAFMLDPLSGDYINNLKSMARAIAEGA